MDSAIFQRLEDFERQGQALLFQYSTRLTEHSQRGRGKKNMGRIVDLTLSKRSQKKAGKFLVDVFMDPGSKSTIITEFSNTTDLWLTSITVFLKDVSKVTGSLSKRGNSSTLIRTFNQAKDAVKPDTKLRKGLAAIDRLKANDLIFNRDIPEYLREQKVTEVTERHTWTRDFTKLLQDHNPERIALLGAIESFEARGMDANRQCLSSCRNCIETLVKKLSGNNNWSEGLTPIVASEQKRKIIRTTYAYLSNHGIHGDQIPSDADTRAGIEQTLAAVRLILTSTK